MVIAQSFVEDIFRYNLGSNISTMKLLGPKRIQTALELAAQYLQDKPLVHARILSKLAIRSFLDNRKESAEGYWLVSMSLYESQGRLDDAADQAMNLRDFKHALELYDQIIASFTVKEDYRNAAEWSSEAAERCIEMKHMKGGNLDISPLELVVSYATRAGDLIWQHDSSMALDFYDNAIDIAYSGKRYSQAIDLCERILGQLETVRPEGFETEIQTYGTKKAAIERKKYKPEYTLKNHLLGRRVS
jgi:tetratricopeptide (TPR) repeat protein